MQLQQIKTEEWQNGDYDTIAVLRGNSENLSKQLGIRFEEDFVEGLGEAKIACFLTNKGNQFSLVEYLQSPTPNWVYVQSLNDAQKMAANLEEILQLLKASPEDLVWSHPKLVKEELEALSF